MTEITTAPVTATCMPDPDCEVRSLASPAMTRQELRRHILQALADIRVIESEALEQELIAAGDNLVIDSKEGEVVIAMLEAELGQELPGPADLDPHEYTSIEALVRLVERKLRASNRG